VHRGHIAAMEAARAYAEEYLQVTIVAGYLAVATNSYTTSKYGAAAIHGRARLDMCNLVAGEHDLLHETPQFYGSARCCGEAMVKAHHERDTLILVICGEDKAAGKRQKRDHIYMSRSSRPPPGLVPTPEATAHVSATLVRRMLREAASLESGVEQVVREGLLSPSVGAYMVAQQPSVFAGLLLASTAEKGSRGRGVRPTAGGAQGPAAAAAAASSSSSSRAPASSPPAQPPPAAAHRKGRWCRPGEPEPEGGGETVVVTQAPAATDDDDGDQQAAAASVPGRRWAAGRSTLRRERLSIVFDMETGDPDDVLTLLLLCAHPEVELRAVTITPGSGEQVALVQWLLQQVGLDKQVMVGAQEWPANADKPGCLRGKFYNCFERAPRKEWTQVDTAAAVLQRCCDEHTTLLTGGPLHNLGAALQVEDFRVGRWVAQGGFAGEGVVPQHLQMDKFAGKKSCPTWNFNGNIAAAEAALASEAIGRRVLVSKNVCHRVVYDAALHEDLKAAVQQAGADGRVQREAALRLICTSMEKYAKEKKLHDPLALAAALDESVCTFAEVSVFRDKGGWGSRLTAATDTWISVDYDDALFRTALLGHSPVKLDCFLR